MLPEQRRKTEIWYHQLDLETQLNRVELRLHALSTKSTGVKFKRKAPFSYH